MGAEVKTAICYPHESAEEEHLLKSVGKCSNCGSLVPGLGTVVNLKGCWFEVPLKYCPGCGAQLTPPEVHS